MSGFCGEGDGVYQAVIKTDGKLKFTAIDDPCTYRVSKFDKNLPGALNEYVVEFTRVENR